MPLIAISCPFCQLIMKASRSLGRFPAWAKVMILFKDSGVQDSSLPGLKASSCP